jgi:predicted NBD/HSP70 family sugar kinase
MSKGKSVLAFDIGGTKIASALVGYTAGGYELRDYRKGETPQGRAALVARILEAAEDYGRKYQFDKIGIALAGQINLAGETVMGAPNIPALAGCKLGKMVATKTGCQVRLQNDVRAFARGEDAYGRYRESRDALFLTVGTGIGGAIKIGGKFYDGHDNIAGEFGHMAVESEGEKCGCGRCGCWERYVAGRAVEEAYRKAYGEEKKAQEIFSAAAKGSTRELSIVQRAAAHFAAGLITLINVLNPEVIVLGGSMMRDGLLLKLALPIVRREALGAGRKTKIVRSTLRDEAALLGAALV